MTATTKDPDHATIAAKPAANDSYPSNTSSNNGYQDSYRGNDCYPSHNDSVD